MCDELVQRKLKFITPVLKGQTQGITDTTPLVPLPKFQSCRSPQGAYTYPWTISLWI